MEEIRSIRVIVVGGPQGHQSSQTQPRQELVTAQKYAQVVRLHKDGVAWKDIAEQLDLSMETVEQVIRYYEYIGRKAETTASHRPSQETLQDLYDAVIHRKNAVDVWFEHLSEQGRSVERIREVRGSVSDDEWVTVCQFLVMAGKQQAYDALLKDIEAEEGDTEDAE